MRLNISNPFKRSEKRATTTAKLSSSYLGEFLGQRTGSNGYVDTAQASRHAIAIACQNAISGALCSVPLKLYRRTPNGGREAATDHPLFEVLQYNFNSQLEAYHGREWLIASALQYGNAPARIEHNGRGQVIGLHPLDWRYVIVERLQSGRLRYKVQRPNEGTQILLQEEVLHIRHRTEDGVIGISPIQHARQTFALAMSQNNEAMSQSDNAFRPSGAVVFPQILGGDNKEQLLERFKERFIGASKANEVMVLDGGVDFKTFSQINKDAEFLESRKLSNLDVCRIYGVPPSAVGITDNATYSNIGEESRALVTRCVAPWAKRIEQSLNSALLSPDARKRYFIEHDLAGLLRGDLAARYTAYRIGKEWGWLSTNEIRGFENMQSVDGGDEYLSPLNMQASAAKVEA